MNLKIVYKPKKKEKGATTPSTPSSSQPKKRNEEKRQKKKERIAEGRKTIKNICMCTLIAIIFRLRRSVEIVWKLCELLPERRLR